MKTPAKLLLCCCCLLLAAAPSLATAAEDADLYRREIEPILREHCYRCHGEQVRKSELRLSTPAGLLKGGESGPVIVPGKPHDSLLLEMLQDGAMPPDDQPGPSPQQVEAIERWIAAGAPLPAADSQQAAVSEHRINALMLLRCAPCHGSRRQEAGLDLRSRQSILKGGKSGPAAVAGQPDESLILQRIKAGEMPPRRLLVSVSVKPMEASELELLTSWIRQGMPPSDVPPDVATTEPDPLVTDKDRKFWSFQPPRAADPPQVRDAHRVRNPIDAFVLHRLQARELTLAPEADRLTLLRRVFLDVTGLPPSPEQVQAFLSDTRRLAYERAVERLLASPHYGERWGRHWLDAAGYADSEGAQNEDRLRPDMYRYRDYVIQSLNADKPYDRFLHEQIAGDELDRYDGHDSITERVYDNLVATGFLRTASDRTFADITNFVPERLQVIADEVQILGSAVMGLTLHCARCHSHKLDPIPQRDYYRLAAVLKDAYDEHDWLKSQGPRTLPLVTAGERRRWEEHEDQLNARIKSLMQAAQEEKDEARQKELQAQIKSVEGQRRAEPRIRALWSRGAPSPTYLLQRGDYRQPGRLVGPGVPSVLTDGRTPFEYQPPWPDAEKTGRRLALARWLTAPGQPLTARVMVNRIWAHHFGTGLVATLDNFGRAGQPPSHEQLLDWLAVELQRQGWSVKAMHRLILTSSTYRQSSQVSERARQLDPDGRLLSAMPLRRMEAEVIRDSLLLAAGRLDRTQFGPADGVALRGDGLVTSQPAEGPWRRSIYVLQRRTQIPTLLENFDYPQMGPNCSGRRESIVATQALHMMNDAQVRRLAEQFAARVRREAGPQVSDQIERAWLIACGRRPDERSRRAAQQALADLTRQWSDQLAAAQDAGTDEPIQRKAEQRALVNLCHALMNSAAFIYVD